MTAEAPKRIWATPSFARGVNGPHRNVLGEAAIQYVRADIADDMLEALKALLEDSGTEYLRSKNWNSARDAIAKAEGTTE